ncbi:hypothetical protein ASPTUDRAFT_47939 [Aspergillus tubingensis CBS 134.48]|uniref:Uncharacterized protein n=1 Tax=Aspergillus tubingensis (strain CBS 134.48) TaxID=767770 RepID=A0A1L9MQK8_ASPTC|nr:hypothetical protein ASPTUDRAFT_47939 [Aspergillus tubingensis CBS 134.48]
MCYGRPGDRVLYTQSNFGQHAVEQKIESKTNEYHNILQTLQAAKIENKGLRREIDALEVLLEVYKRRLNSQG